MRFRAKNSKIREYTTRANQIVRITSDFEMDVVNRLASCVRATERERSLNYQFFPSFRLCLRQENIS